MKLLPVKWPDSATPDDGRPTRGAAGTMLADVYANMSGEPIKQNKWAEAAAAAKAVIDSKAYSLVPDVARALAGEEQERAGARLLDPVRGTDPESVHDASRVRAASAPRSGINYWCTTPEFMDTFSDTDLRKKVTFLTQVTVGTTTFYYDTRGTVKGFGDKSPRFPKPLPYYGKFYDNGGQSIALNSGRSNLNWPVYRYAETLLLHAEAENEANGPGERLRVDQRGACPRGLAARSRG